MRVRLCVRAARRQPGAPSPSAAAAAIGLAQCVRAVRACRRCRCLCERGAAAITKPAPAAEVVEVGATAAASVVVVVVVAAAATTAPVVQHNGRNVVKVKVR